MERVSKSGTVRFSIRSPGSHPCHLFVFLSDPSPIFVYPCYLLTDSRLVDLIDVTLVYEDTNSKLVEVVTLADVDCEKRVDDTCCRLGS